MSLIIKFYTFGFLSHLIHHIAVGVNVNKMPLQKETKKRDFKEFFFLNGNLHVLWKSAKEAR